MARILKWQEKLVLACAALFFSVTSGFGLGPRDSAGASRPSSSRIVTVGKSAAGIELMAHKPYVRLVHASLIPVSIPLAVGAYVAMAGAITAAAAPAGEASPAVDPAAEAASSCGGSTKPGSTHSACYTVYCAGSFSPGPPGQHTCHTCGYGTCGVCC